MAEVPDCCDCGACCFSRLSAYVRVPGADYTLLGERAAELVCFESNRAYMRMSEGHCLALKVDVALRRFTCNTYATRPQICRELERGSSACRGELAAKHERTLLALVCVLPLPA
jgi:Fe-S-cluster containining protein